MNNKMIVRAVLLDFSAAFDVIDHKLLLKNSLALALHHLPTDGWGDIYPIEPGFWSSMEASLISDMSSALSLWALPFSR